MKRDAGGQPLHHSGSEFGVTNLLIDAQVPMHLLEWIQVQVSSPLEFLMWMNLALLDGLHDGYFFRHRHRHAYCCRWRRTSASIRCIWASSFWPI